jgi:hypothetical protein
VKPPRNIGERAKTLSDSVRRDNGKLYRRVNANTQNRELLALPAALLSA